MSGPSPIVIDIRVGGLAGVQQAFTSVEKAMDRMARNGSSATERAAGQRIKTEQAAARAIGKAAADGEKQRERSAASSARSADQAARAGVKTAEQTEHAKTRATEQAARARLQMQTNSLRMEQSMREKMARQEIATFEKVQQARRSRASSVGGIVGRGVSRGLGTVGRIAGAAAAIGGGFTIADSLQRGVADEAAAGQLVRSASESGGFTKKDVMTAASKQTIEKGVDKADVIAGIDEFVKKSGSLKAAMGLMDELASLSAATGASMSDLGMTAGDVFNKTGNVDDVIAVMRNFAGQGQAGAVDIRDLGEYGSRLTATAGRFTGNLVGNIGAMGALAQTAVKTGTANDARVGTTAVMALAEDVSSKSDKFAALNGGGKGGVNVWADAGQTKLRAPQDIISESVFKTKGNQRELGKLFNGESSKIVQGFANTFNTAGGGQAGMKAMQDLFASIKEQTMTSAQIQAGVDDKKTEMSAKLASAHEKLQQAINEKLLPLLPELVDKFSKLIPAISSVVEWLSANPIKGVGALVLGQISADIAAAGVGAGVKMAIMAMMSGGGGSVAAGVGATGAAGAVSSGAGVLSGAARFAGVAGLAYGAYELNHATGDNAKAQEGRQSSVAAMIAQGGLAGSEVQTPEGLATARASAARIRAMLTQGDAFSQKGELAKVGTALNPFDSAGADADAMGSIVQKKRADLERSLDMLTKALRTASDQIADNSGDGRANTNDMSRLPVGSP